MADANLESMARALEACRAHAGDSGLLALRALGAAKIEDWRDEMEHTTDPVLLHQLQGKISGMRDIMADIWPRD
ncbi:MAG: hypothetical protein HY916_09155 [Desulfovibrio sp.]|jgi:hypothetical protein|nr:hypothetical protein [Desulfovibrio sp.]